MNTALRLQVATATLILLAGCAGEGGSNRVIANSPPPPGTPTPDITNPGGTLPGTPLPAPAPAPIPLPPPIDSKAPLISATGVRGDVLLTMMDQQPCRQFPVPTANYNGANIDQTRTGVTDVFVNHDLSPSNYVTDTAASGGTPVPGDTCAGKRYEQARPGVYTYNIDSIPWYRNKIGSAWLSRGFNWLDLKATLTVTATTASLGTRMTVESTRDNTPYPVAIQQTMTPMTENTELSAPSALDIELGSVINYGVLKQWRNAQTNALMSQVMLIRGDAANEAKLCWNTDIQFTKRLQCAVWRVPANWQRGQQLTLVEQYLIEDRKPYPNEQGGFLYWRTAR